MEITEVILITLNILLLCMFFFKVLMVKPTSEFEVKSFPSGKTHNKTKFKPKFNDEVEVENRRLENE